ncbi:MULTISPECIES: dienelactone hydrolase family protein [Caballeronia]|uniref:Prolyl oligopeptidase family serine peptidase n=2 Tax=Caballeronia novacaledonica TaxID=1544861 RepID=A0AA37MGD4_9BURK|nr:MULTISPECIES: prolyl oligopeptidase family serine peptidase [Caballeronia]MBC8641793.1 prolyl oligopeptidase family serine peptidase [Caballeronia sp. EK]GJH07604.1 prolyl oligopeptidase family serine peptidase [Caballeronia novacaledonica]GJH18550.1 prolyl oligopeptidase family serine peptidase [Caballeronia novacaledonica]GJH23113.1 prolyl oligopeptidase family serine peptidase [Caballeronia novacaledonica]
MAIRTWLVGCSMVCALATSLVTSAVRAEPIGGVRQSEGLQAPAFGQPLSRIPDSLDAGLPAVSNGLNEAVIEIPEADIALETTVFKPDGAGPFPMIVFNHGKLPGDSHAQPRNRPVALAREFVRHGYVVVVPNRRGFAGSGGEYAGHGCDVEANGFAQAQDVAATVAYMSEQSYIDKTRIVVAGTSHGGLTTIAYGARDAVAAPGVRGLINFSGGLRQDECTGWQKNLVSAFGDYGQNVRLPSLWLYGDNDSVWQGDLSVQMYTAFTSHGARANMVDFGTYKNDAHRLVGDRDGVQIWWPRVKAFLAQIGMPTAVQYQVSEPDMPKATNFADLDSVQAVPYVDETGRAGYRNFLSQYSSRAFAVSDSGAWSWAEGGDDPMAVAIASCQKQSADPCRLYAVNNRVVWNDQAAETQTASR